MPATGLLEILGTIDLAQFWPTGLSDADTSKLKVTVGANSFRFRRSPADAFAVTHVFDDAIVRGKVTKPAIDKDSRVTIRLQGIDAPELHYRPSAERKKTLRSAEQQRLYLEWNLEYRQRLAETATVELREFLRRGGHDPLPCVVRTSVDAPGDAFDTYGRLVGDVYVTIGTKETDVNLWLVEQGWAFPAFYNSMSNEEIDLFYMAGRDAAKDRRGVWGIYDKAIGRLDFDLEFERKKTAPDTNDDEKPLVMPKLFRRLSTWAVNKRARMVSSTFDRYVEDRKDYCHERLDFLAQRTAADIRTLDEFIDGGKFTIAPDELVFREKASNLVRPGGGVADW
jgi:endonuclease YncB( thermonuclease family)